METLDIVGYSLTGVFGSILALFLVFVCWTHWLSRKCSSSSLYQKLDDSSDSVVLVKKAEQSSVNCIENSILNRLRQDLSRTKVTLTEQSWTPDQASEGTPVIVFCVYSSRLGVDIESAMRGVQDNAKVVLVVLHPKLRSLLRGDLSSEEDLLNSALINRMSAIAHFAFSDQEGLYTCHQNDTGSEKLFNGLMN